VQLILQYPVKKNTKGVDISPNISKNVISIIFYLFKMAVAKKAKKPVAKKKTVKKKVTVKALKVARKPAKKKTAAKRK